METTRPISERWDSDKWRMWRLVNGSWIAVQPLRVREPMFARLSDHFNKPSHQFINRDPRVVLHEMQLAIAKAAA